MTDTDDTETTAEQPAAATANSSPSEDELDRRRLLTWLVVAAFLVPVVVEVVTFGNLILDWLGPGGGESSGPETGTQTPTAGPDAVGVGEQLLPETDPVETVEQSVVRGATDRTYILRVSVENSTAESVDLRLGALTLYDGTTVAGRSRTGEIESGDSGTVTGAWSLPNDEMPRRVAVRETSDDSVLADETVVLARPPIDAE